MTRKCNISICPSVHLLKLICTFEFYNVKATYQIVSSTAKSFKEFLPNDTNIKPSVNVAMKYISVRQQQTLLITVPLITTIYTIYN